VERPLFLYPPGVVRNQHGRFLWGSARGAVRRLYRAFRPDAVLSYWTHPDGEAALRAAVEADAPLVLIVGGSDVLVLAEQVARRATFLRVLQGADLILAVGPDLRGRVISLGVPPEKVEVHHRGVSEGFSPGDKAAARAALGLDAAGSGLLWVGNIVPVKAVGVLLDAAERLAADGHPLRVFLIGDGPQRGRLQARAAAPGLAGRVVFAGAVGHTTLPLWYRAADLTVLPSLSEGVPNVLLESLACGTPFVASRVGSIPDLTSDPESDLVPPGDPVALAQAIRARLSTPSSCGEGRVPPARPWSDSAAHIGAILDKVLRDRRKAEPHGEARPRA
jgi:glycosyltransferase involved in cell wall biosynthesis